MTVRTGATIHFSEGDVRHHWHPGSDDCEPYGALKFELVATVFFATPAQVDEVIAELAKLRAEMTAGPGPSAGEDASATGAPRPVTRTGETGCGAEDNGYVCNAQKNHDGPDHIAYGSGSQECHRWPVRQPASVTAPGVVGAIVVDAADDSPCPVTGKVVGQVDEETVEVLWGERQFEEHPGPGKYEPVDGLRPALQQRQVTA